MPEFIFTASFWVDTNDFSVIVVFGVGGDIDKEGACSSILEFDGSNIQPYEAEANFFFGF